LVMAHWSRPALPFVLLCAWCRAVDGCQHCPWTVRQSACTKHMQPYDIFPMRSPLVVADFLAERLRSSQAFAEIGTRDGDNIVCVSELAQVRTYAVEQSARRCQTLRERGGVDVIEAQVNETSHLQVIPDADVFYFWMELKVNRDLVRWTHRALLARGRRAVLFAGYDWHYKSDRRHFAETVQEFNQTFGGVHVHRLFFDERPDFADVTSTYNVSYGPEIGIGPNPSYEKPFAGRPGQWGVFHLVEVPVGRR
jgi:hypothetical protein